MSNSNKLIEEYKRGEQIKILKKYLPWAAVLLVLTSGIILYNVGDEEIIEGTLNGVTTRYSDVGTEVLLKVELEDGSSVLVPHHGATLLMKSKKVTIARKKTMLFGAYRYRFVSYSQEAK